MPGTYVVVAYTRAEGAIALVELGAGATKRLRLVSGGRGRITGRLVELGTGAPVVGVPCHTVLAGPVRFTPAWAREDLVVTGADGRFTLEPAPAGPVRVRCVPDGDELSEGRVDLEVPRGGAAEVTVPVVRPRCDGATARRLGLEIDRGGALTTLTLQGAAMAAGLRSGDVVVSVNGTAVAGLPPTAVRWHVLNEAMRGPVDLVVTRAGGPLRVRLPAP